MDYLDLNSELEFSEKYRMEFLNMIRGLKEADLENVRIEGKEVGQSKKTWRLSEPNSVTRICSYWTNVRLLKNCWN